MIPYRPVCKDCGENLEVDGYNSVIYCPNISDIQYGEMVAYAEPDAGPIYCGWTDKEPDELESNLGENI